VCGTLGSESVGMRVLTAIVALTPALMNALDGAERAKGKGDQDEDVRMEEGSGAPVPAKEAPPVFPKKVAVADANSEKSMYPGYTISFLYLYYGSPPKTLESVRLQRRRVR
jgi:hypothetical protein